MLKIKLDVSSEKKEQIKKVLEEHGIVISDTADLVISENMENSYINCKKDNSIYRVSIEDIVYLESQDHDLVVRTEEGFYKMRETISFFEKYLPLYFIRVHRSYIVNKNKIDHITPLLGMQFHLKMITKEKISVSRSYYYQFKEKVGI